MKPIAKYPLKVMAYLLFKSPYWVRRFLGCVIGVLWFDILRIRRSVILKNLNLAYPGWSYKQKVKTGRNSLCCLGQNIVELSFLPFLTSNMFSDFFEFKGFENYLKAKAKNKGVCILTLHLGNYDLATAGMALYGHPLVVISKEFKTQWLNDLWFGVRRKMGTEFIAPRNSSYAILKALKKKKSVVFVQDQFTGPPIGVRTEFFGHTTGTALGLSVMASRSEAPVVPIYSYRDSNGKVIVHFEEEIPYQHGENRDLAQARMTQVYTKWTEDCIRKHPGQWLWVHRRWKPFRD